MEKWATKKNVFIVSALGLVLSYVLNNPMKFGLCFNEYMLSGHTYCKDNFQYILSHFLFFLSISLFPISLLTLFLKEGVFRAWWNFAKWAVPVLMFFTYILNGSGGGGFGINNGAFNIVFIGFLYLVFIFISLIKIVRAHKRLKREEESQPGFQKDSGMTLAEGIAYRWKEWRK